MKKMTYILVIIIVLFILYYFVFKKSEYEKEFAFVLKKVKNRYGENIAKNVEKMYRLETNHFKSGQFKGTYSPGMEKFGNNYPYGWNTIAKIFWDIYPINQPVGFWSGKEGKTGKQKTFLKFPSLQSAVFTLAEFLKHYGNNPGRWYSLNKDSQTRYNNSISKINTPIYDSIS